MLRLRRGHLPGRSSSSSSYPNPSASEPKKSAAALAELVNGHSVPWPPQVHSALAALSPQLSRDAIVLSLDLIKPPATALRVFQWAKLSQPLDDRAHFKMLQVLCRCRNLSPAVDFLHSLDKRILHDRFFNAVIRACARSGELRRALHLFDEMRKDFAVSPSVFSFNTLLSVLLPRGRTRAALSLFHDMPRFGVKPDVCTFNTLIRGLCLNSMEEEALGLFREMGLWRLKPDVRTFNAVLHGLCRKGMTGDACKLLDEMRDPSIVSFTIVIRGFLERRRVPEAMNLLGKMAEAGIRPSEVTFNTLLRGLCENQRPDLIKEIMAEGGWAGFKPDTCSFNTLISSHCGRGAVGDALAVFDQMPSLKVMPDSATYSVLISALCEGGEGERAEALLEEMMEKKVLQRSSAPLMAAFNPVFSRLCHGGKAGKALILFRLLLARGAAMDVTSSKILIRGLCEEGDFRRAHAITAEMARRELGPGVEAFERLINGFLNVGEGRFAMKALEKMLGRGHRPKTAIFHSVLAVADGREARALLETMLERKVRPRLDLTTGLVSKLFKDGLRDEAFGVLARLYGSGFEVKMEEVIEALCESERLDEARDLVLFWLKQPAGKKKKKAEGEVCGEVLRRLSHGGRAAEAFELFKKALDRELGLPAGCLEALETALRADGKLPQADFVRRRRPEQEGKS
ncbi:tetratricopeptide repeat (TPR)-like superfamily protein [Wolffia australiana]